MPVYCITGANRGLGLEFVRQIATASQDNTILALTRSLSSDLTDLKAASASNPKPHILECDTSNASSINAFATTAAPKALGGRKIDFLINNAGINTAPEQTSLTIDPAALEQEIRTNVLGPAKTVEYLLAGSLLAPDARIVNMSSGLGSMAVSLSISPRKCATYSISKAALNALTVQQSGDLRMEGRLGEGCVVICMDPGWVKTRMGGEGALLEPEESISGMLRCIHGLEGGGNGKFFTYTGKEVPW